MSLIRKMQKFLKQKKRCDIDRSAWKGIMHNGIYFEIHRVDQAQNKRNLLKLRSETHIDLQQSISSHFTAAVCGCVCAAQVGLFSHMKTDKCS